MKISLIVVPFVLLVLLNACSSGTLPPFSDPQWTAIAITQQVMRQEYEQKIFAWLKDERATPPPMEMLGQTILGQYQVTGVVVTPITDTSNVLQVIVTCTCPLGGMECYNPDQMFMAVMLKMKPHANEIIAQVPVEVKELWVVRNIEATVSWGLPKDSGRSVDWGYVKQFLQGHMDGIQFGRMVTPGAVPE